MAKNRIVFTGHRDAICATESLDLIHADNPDSIWIHGGVEGFDTQIATYAAEHGIQTICIKPDYKKYPAKVAPLRRNDLMLSMADSVVALYDGRSTGGTKYTVEKAKKLHLPITYITRK